MAYIHSFGDDTTATTVAVPAVAAPAPTATESLKDFANSDFVSTAAALLLTYHGYKRTGSIIWSLLYGLAGREFPIEAVPIAIGQGFGKKKPCP